MIQIRKSSPGDQFKRIKRKYFTEWAVKFWNLLLWEAVEAAGRKFTKGLEIIRFVNILKGTGIAMPPYISNLMTVETGQV